MLTNVITPPAPHTIAPADEMFDAVFPRSSNFRIEMDWDTALGFIRRIDQWNEFDSDAVVNVLETIDDIIPKTIDGERGFRIIIGCEFSPVIYLQRYESDDSHLTNEVMQSICTVMELCARADDAHFDIRELSGDCRRIDFRFWWD